MYKMKIATTLLLVASIVGCAHNQIAAKVEHSPQLVQKNAVASYFDHDGRLYVIGKESTKATFAKSPHLPYTRTLIGAGPQGQTVIFEVDKKNPALVESLFENYEKTPWQIASNDKDFFVYKVHGRLYVLGKKVTADKFVKNPHLPYTRTLIGAGPQGETLIFEVDKKNPAFALRLEKEYRKI